jgi:hypothetical protein
VNAEELLGKKYGVDAVWEGFKLLYI